MHSTDSRPIALVGLMGAGKSATARALGERLGVAAADLDSMIEAESGESVARLFENPGEAWFRTREGELLAQALDARVGVVACGGGVVLDPRHRALLRARCRVVWLEVDPAEAARRVALDGASRPLLAGAPASDRLSELLAARRALYEEVAAFRIPTDGRSPGQVADAVLAALKGAS
jgi:shikimate kinase